MVNFICGTGPTEWNRGFSSCELIVLLRRIKKEGAFLELRIIHRVNYVTSLITLNIRVL